MRFLALLSLFLLSACSYDPYHYYYSCEGADDKYNYPDVSGRKTTYHLHNKTLTTASDRIYKWKSQTSMNTTYEYLYKMQFEDDYYSYQHRFNKIDNSLLSIVYDNKGIVVTSSSHTCSVEKTLFAK